MIDNLLGYIAPHHCFGCGKIGVELCDNCKYDIVDESFSGCIVCARPSLVGICARCKTAYEKAWCIGDREGALEQLIDAYKFERMKHASVELASLLNATLPVLPAETVVVPIPTVQSHIRVRGYDHALLLAREFAKRRRLRMTPIIKRTNAASQRELGRRQRFDEAKRAFRCGKALENVPYLIIDDIVTTNATLRCAAEALRDAGAQTVWAAVIARQPLDKQG